MRLEMGMDLTRRSLLSGAAITGAAAAAAAVGVTVTNKGKATTPAAETETNPYLHIYGDNVNYLPVKKPGEWNYMQGTPAFEDREIAESELMWTESCDFVVVGAGVCGIMACLKAGSEGANVVCIEKMSRGRNTWESVGGYGSRAQAESGNEIDPARFVDAILRSGYYRAIPEVVWSYVRNSGEAIDFMQDMMNETDYDIQIYNTTQPETGYDLVTIQAEHKFKINGPVEWTAHLTGMFPMAALTTRAEMMDNVDLRMYTAGVQLVQNETGRVTGIIAKNEDGYYRIDASKGILLATGGYENNYELMKAWLRPEDYMYSVPDFPCVGPTGDGHMMGLKVGANMDPIPHAPMIFNGTCPDIRSSNHLSIRRTVYAVSPMVDGNGRRFCNESHQKDMLANSINMAVSFTGGAWYIFDQTVASAATEDLSQYYGNGTLTMGETLEELAEKLGIPAENLVETVTNWNGYLAQETPIDPEFRRDLVSINTVVAALTDGKVQAACLPIETGPFYALISRDILLCTVSGLIINGDCQVLDTEGKVIEGLYAGGNASGGMYASTYPRHLPSVSVGRAATFGYVAARKAMSEE